jgi:5'-AMP-activated protein kinase regulatory gamma subunit
VIPESGKIVIIDTRISIKNAFFALMENEIRCAPLWDSHKKQFVGMITMTNFINLLCHLHSRSDKAAILKELEDRQISVFAEIGGDRAAPVSALITTTPEDTLLNAARLLATRNIHRIPIVDPRDNCIIHIVTHVRIIRHLVSQLPNPRPAVFNRSIAELKVGTFSKIVARPLGTRLIDLFNLFAETGYSAIPIVDANDHLYDIYSKGDVPSLAIHRTYMQLDRPVEEVISESRAKKSLHTCTVNSTLFEVIERLLSQKTHRLFCVDEQFKIQGVVSLIDILRFFLSES